MQEYGFRAANMLPEIVGGCGNSWFEANLLTPPSPSSQIPFSFILLAFDIY